MIVQSRHRLRGKFGLLLSLVLLMSLIWPSRSAVTQPVVTQTGTPTSAVVSVGITSTTVIAVPATNTLRYRFRIQNTSYITPSGGNDVAVWCSWGAAAVVRGTTSFLLLRGESLEAGAPGVDQRALNCIAESLTVNVYYSVYGS